MSTSDICDGLAVSKELLEWAENAPIKTLPGLFRNTVEQWGERPYLGKREDGSYQFQTYAQIYEQVLNFASALVYLGLDKDTRVANFSTNRGEWPVVDFGCGFAACIHAPMYPTLSQSEMAYIVRDSGAVVVVASSNEHVKKVLGALNELPLVRHVVAVDPFDLGECQLPENVSFWQWDQLMDLGQEHRQALAPELERRFNELKADDICSFVYTSGTTGDPKGAMLMHGNFVSAAYCLGPLIAISCEDVQLSFLPLSHVFERIVYYGVTSNGASIGYARGIQSVPQDLKLLKPTLVPSVPRLFEKVFARVIEQSGGGLKNTLFRSALKVGRDYRLAKAEGKVSAILKAKYAMADKTVFSKIRETTGGRVRYFISGGAPLRSDVAEFFMDVGLCILEGYGLTETSPVLTVNLPEKVKIGTVGPAVPGVTVMIDDDGEIVARGPNVMRGYHGRVEATKQVIDAAGWFHTGDVGNLDEDGYLTITDRKKEILVLSNGKNVAPQPIELAIVASDWIQQAMLVGNDRAFVGALIVPDFGRLEAWLKAENLPLNRHQIVSDERIMSLLMNEVRKACAELSNYEKVKRIAILPRELSAEEGEITPTLKIKRRVVSERFNSLIEGMYVRSAKSVLDTVTESETFSPTVQAEASVTQKLQSTASKLLGHLLKKN